MKISGILANGAWHANTSDEAVCDIIAIFAILLFEFFTDPVFGDWVDAVADCAFFLSNFSVVTTVLAWCAENSIKAYVDITEASEWTARV